MADTKRRRVSILGPIDVKIKRGRWKTFLLNMPLFALLFSAAAVIITYRNFLYEGPLRTLPLTAYSIMRGYEDGEFPSDHLILPIEWVNDYGPPALARQPSLTLKRLDDKWNEIKGAEPLTFFVAGHYREISAPALREPFIQSQAYLIAGHTATQYNLVFHIKGWCDANDATTFCFNFKPQTKYSVTLRFQDKDEYWHEIILGNIDTHDVDKFIKRKIEKTDKKICGEVTTTDAELKKGRWWDYHSVRLKEP